jgi:hypothetical protein
MLMWISAEVEFTHGGSLIKLFNDNLITKKPKVINSLFYYLPQSKLQTFMILNFLTIWLCLRWKRISTGVVFFERIHL